MAILRITHSCGHEAPHAFTGGEAERRKREQWLRERPCQQCWREEQARAASVRLAEWNLPPLEGTEEDKAWAEVIRLKAIAHSRDYRDRVTDPRKFRPGEELMKETVQAAADRALRELEGQTRADWWIANRFEVLTYMKREIVEAVTPLFGGGPG